MKDIKERFQVGWQDPGENYNMLYYFTEDCSEPDKLLASYHSHTSFVYETYDPHEECRKLRHADYFENPYNPSDEEIILWELESGRPFPPKHLRDIVHN